MSLQVCDGLTCLVWSFTILPCSSQAMSKAKLGYNSVEMKPKMDTKPIPILTLVGPASPFEAPPRLWPKPS